MKTNWNMWFIFLCGQTSLGRIPSLGSLVFKGGCIALLSLKFSDIAPKRDKYEI